MRTVCCMALLLLLIGCQSLEPIEAWQQNSSSCTTLVVDDCKGGVEALSLDDTTGSLAAWTRFQGLTIGMTAEQRAQALEKAPEGEVEQLQQVLLLSHPDAGYRERLRAQLRLETILGSLPVGLSNLFNTVYAYNQRLLENESALTLAQRNSTQQKATISELRAKLKALTQIEDKLRHSNQEAPNEP